MIFRYYDPKRLVFELAPIIVGSSFSYVPCPGCIFTGVSPEYSIFPISEMRTSSVQSDLLCAHCSDTVEEVRKRFKFRTDKTFSQRMAELEEIIRMASETQK